MTTQCRTRLFASALAISYAILSGCDYTSDSEFGNATETDTNTPRAVNVVELFTAHRIMTSSEKADLSFVQSLDVDSHGRVYVADWLHPDVIIIDPDGDVDRLIGGRGEGPGEFRRVSSVQIIAGDTLVAFDRSLLRITTFTPETFNVIGSIKLGSGRMLPLAASRVMQDGKFLVSYSWPYTATNSRTYSRQPNTLRVLDASGAVLNDSVLSFPPDQQLIVMSRGLLQVGPHPFGRRSIVRTTGRDRIVFAWTDSLGFGVFSLAGHLADELRMEHSNIPVTPSELARLEALVPASAVEALRSWQPRTWPALKGMVVDDHERVWLGITSEPEFALAEWAIFDITGQYMGSVFLPSTVELHVVKRNKAYGVETDELDVPTIVVYELTPTHTPRRQ